MIPYRVFRVLVLAALATTSGLFSPGVTGLRGGEPPKTTATGNVDPDKSTLPSVDARFFEVEVLPILKSRCWSCHGPEKAKGNLRLSHRAGLLKGGDLGPALNPDTPAESLVLQAIRYEDGLEMPPTGKLPDAERETLTRWIQAKAPYTPALLNAPAGESAGDTGKTEHKPNAPKGGLVTEESKRYWAYRPLQRPEVPQYSGARAEWVKNPIDAFVLAKLDAKHLDPAPPADRTALARRAFYDLTGLPPTPEQIDAFVQDTSPNAYERLIDQLLASPQYGEQWGRAWLDVARFAETNGYERDGPKPFAWRYRDYVIRSFQNDKPFHQFLTEQLAGDEMQGADADAVIATGYFRLGLWDDEPADPEQSRFDEYDDIVATTAQVFLGMTMNCARCHDHKIDPVPQTDYYRFLAFFRDIPPFSKSRDIRSPFNLTDITPPTRRAAYEAALKAREARQETLTQAMTVIEDEVIRRMPAEDQRASEGLDRGAVIANKLAAFLKPEEAQRYNTLKSERDQLKKIPEPERELALSVNRCEKNPPQTHVLIRGSAHAQGPAVEPGFPAVLGDTPPVLPKPSDSAKSSGRRTVLAQWMTNPKANPLTPRVIANRLWQGHWGKGIVATSNDFGRFGTPPTHPQLLDWLADELVQGGWTLKRMHKIIMMSNAYQMSARPSDAAVKADPDNSLLSRFPMRRLKAEEVRDSLLAVSGQLNLKAFGPSVYPVIPKEVLAGQSVPGQGWGRSSPEDASRRSIYVYVKRSLLVPILSQHDMADTDTSCAVRFTTTVPTQSLGMLNSAFLQEQAAAFHKRLLRERPDNRAAQIARGIRLTTGRNPNDAEIQRDLALIQSLVADQKLSQDAAMQHYCLMLMNANEFVYLD